jgi:hypothetical protein
MYVFRTMLKGPRQITPFTTLVPHVWHTLMMEDDINMLVSSSVWHSVFSSYICIHILSDKNFMQGAYN